MSIQHTYQSTITWTGNKGTGTSAYRAYDRNHSISVEGKTEISASSDPAFRGDKTKHNPEDLFLASISSCHMLWYLHLCSEAGIIVEEYTDHASGIMQIREDGGGSFSEVTLKPLVKVSENSMIEKAKELHHKANELCFIANSCNFPIKHEAEIVVGEK